MARNVSLSDAMAGDEQPSTTSTKAAGKQSTKQNKQPAKPVKLTIELDPELHRSLKSFALLQADDASLADIVRAAISLADNDTKFAKTLGNEANRLKSERKSARR